MADFNNPLSTQGYLSLLASIVENNQAALKLLDGVTPLTNLPTGAKRWNPTNARFESWNGSSWVELHALFEMKVRNSDQLNGQSAGYYQNAGNLSAGILPAARFDDSSHGSRGGGSLHALANGSTAGFMSSGHYNKLQGIEAGATADMTPAEILTALLGVDGAGSGLDADMLDGNHAAALLARGNHTGSQIMATISDAGALATLNNVAPGNLSSVSAGDYVIRYAYRRLGQYGAPPYNGTSNNARLGRTNLSSTSYVKYIEFTVGRPGTYRVYTHVLYQQPNHWTRIYKNGAAIGPERANPAAGYYSDDIAFAAGDLCQLYIRCGAVSDPIDVGMLLCGSSALGSSGILYTHMTDVGYRFFDTDTTYGPILDRDISG